MTVNHFDAVHTELRKGVNLIEASAGTGKTYTIAMLSLRFIVEEAMRIEQLLVVTFTNSATEELRERIRSRLFDAKRVLEGQYIRTDRNLADWAGRLSIDKALAIQRINLALLNIDQACIFTIHGFCQRALREYALESGQSFDAELITEISLIRQEIADDFWRNQVYSRTPFDAAVLTAQYSNPDKLLDSVKNIEATAIVYPPPETLENALETVRGRFLQCQKIAGEIHQTLEDAFLEKTFAQSFQTAWYTIFSWLSEETFEVPAQSCILLLTPNEIKNGLNGHKFRNTKSRTAGQRKQDYIDTLGLNTKPFEELCGALRKATLCFRRTLVDEIRLSLARHLRQNNVLSFETMITHLADALQGERGDQLSKALQACYRVAMIDEFQDTDDSQWKIFSTLFRSPEHYLYLIGDPKQAIYRFRGADIFSYFSAREQAQYHYTLAKNWRSHPDLVEAVNLLFDRTKPFLLDQLQQVRAEPALEPGHGALKQADRVFVPMTIWQLAKNPEKEDGYWPSGKADLEIQTVVINEILKLINPQRPVEIIRNDGSRTLRPSDIAILVRRNDQAREYQARLREVGIPSVLCSTESVFGSEDASNLQLLMQSLANPGDGNLLKQSLILDWFGLDGQGFYRTINDEPALDAWFSRFQSYHQIWLQRGFMTMMQTLISTEKVRANLSRFSQAERRITNLHHLIELVQQAAADEHLGITKSVDWLRAAIAESKHVEEHQIRTESDDQAVNIVTLHRAKGLEYPVVFCPYLWQRNSPAKSTNSLIKCHENGELVVDLGSESFESRRTLALNEELAEDLRIFYVAVTRAKYRCYIVWADVRSKQTPNVSAMAYLLHSRGIDRWKDELSNRDFEQQRSTLASLSHRLPGGIEYHTIEVPGSFDGTHTETTDQPRLIARERTRKLDDRWQMSSYTALSALSLKDVPEVPSDKAQEPLKDLHQDHDQPAIPKGPHTGNVVHELLEKTSFKAISQGEDFSALRDSICLRYGVRIEAACLLDKLLQNAVNTALSADDSSFRLANVKEQDCLKEMPFYMAVGNIDTEGINHLLNDTPTFQPMQRRQMQGLLTGFIDLICKFNGRYYVMDYKSNYLPNYGKMELIQAMRAHNYGLQYWIYTSVLHQYLNHRLPDYDYQKHFGGVRYLFIRGMQPDRPLSGVFQTRPSLERLKRLQAILDPARCNDSA